MPDVNIPEADKITFALSSLSSLVATQTGPDLEAQLYKEIIHNLQSMQSVIGQWDVVWGPSVVQLNTDLFAINSMYVAQSGDTPSKYVVAIAGTNPASAFDWLVEDLLVEVQIPWVYGLLSAPDAKIALGTAIGLSILQNMQPSGERPQAGVTLIDFLKSVASLGAVEIQTTGHSLGGALSPAVALWLKDTQGTPLLWDPTGNATIASMPTAGPTLGNQAFASYYDAQLGNTTTRYANAKDVVPQAWNSKSLEGVKTIYVPDIPSSEVVDDLVDRLLRASVKGDYVHMQAGASPLPGEVSEKYIIEVLPPIVNFFIQLIYQHTKAYLTWFGLTEIQQAIFSAMKAAVPEYGISGRVMRALKRTGVSIPPGMPEVSTDKVSDQVPVGDKLITLPDKHDDSAINALVDSVVNELKKFG